VSLDLSTLKDVNSRAILANLLLKVIYDHAINRGEQTSLKHALFIEEAQNVLPPRRIDAPQSIGERILAEVRKYGEGVVIISQFPSAVSFDVIKNTSVRIIHAVRAGDDAKVLGEATSLDLAQRSVLSSLAQGEAIVNLPLRPANYFVRVIPDPLLEMPDLIGSVPEAAPHPPTG
jgi:DNA helicase HerA-like ATPase